MKVVRFSALRTGRLYPRRYPWYSFLLEYELTHSAAPSISSIKNPSDIVNQTRDHPVCSAVPKPTAPSRTPLYQYCEHAQKI